MRKSEVILNSPFALIETNDENNERRIVPVDNLKDVLVRFSHYEIYSRLFVDVTLTKEGETYSLKCLGIKSSAFFKLDRSVEFDSIKEEIHPEIIKYHEDDFKDKEFTLDIKPKICLINTLRESVGVFKTFLIRMKLLKPKESDIVTMLNYPYNRWHSTYLLKRDFMNHTKDFQMDWINIPIVVRKK